MSKTKLFSTVRWTNDQEQKTSEIVNIDNDSSDTFEDLHLAMDQIEKTAQIPDNTSKDPMTKNRRIVEATTVEHTHQTPDTINAIEKDLDPIVGYAAEPILPLTEACAPLESIINDLSAYVQLALDGTPDEPSDGLTIDESAAVRLYTIEWQGSQRSLYSMLNRTLKNGDREQLRPYFKYLKLFLTALVKLPCVPPVTVWRGITKDQSANFPAGKRVTWWAFSSCTTTNDCSRE